LAAATTTIQPTRTIECGPDDCRPSVVTSVALTSDSRSVIAATDDHHIFIWDVASGALQKRLGGHTDWVRSVAVAPTGGLIASAANDRSVRLWSHSGESLPVLPAFDAAVANVRIHVNGQQLGVVGFSQSLQIVNISTGQVTQRYECPCEDQRAVAFSPDGARMAAAGRNGRIRVWTIGAGGEVRDVDTDGRPIRSLAFSPSGRLIGAGGDGTGVRIIDAATGATRQTIGIRPAKVFAVAFLGEQRIATAGSDNCIHIWNLVDGERVATLVGHTGTVAALTADPAGSTLVSGSYDTTVRIWNMAERTDAAAANMPRYQTR
jgi:WD40 repeat protein